MFLSVHVLVTINSHVVGMFGLVNCTFAIRPKRCFNYLRLFFPGVPVSMAADIVYLKNINVTVLKYK